MLQFKSEALAAAYANAVYSVHVDGSDLQFRVNQRCPPLDELLAVHSARFAAFITAANPRSRQLSDAENAQRTAHLATVLANAGFHYLLGEGRDPCGEWPPEQSLLIMNIERTEAALLARQHGQYGWLFLQTGHAPELVLEPLISPHHSPLDSQTD